MNRCDWLTALLVVLPVLATLAGIWIGHRLESGRQEAQRAHEREARQRQDRRNVLEQLQFALAAIRDGTYVAAVLLAVDRRVGAEVARGVLAEPWWRDWQAAFQRVNALAAQLADEELSEAVNAVGFPSDLWDALQGEGADRALDEGLPELDAAYGRANAIAGRMIYEIDTFQPPAERRTWLGGPARS